MSSVRVAAPAWARWRSDPDRGPYTLGVEEEIMLLRPDGWALAQEIDEVLPALPAELAKRATAEVHGAALELRTGPHGGIAGVRAELAGLRAELDASLQALGLRAASAGTHPFAVWEDTTIASGERYRVLYGSMRELVRREPTFGLHVHVGVPGPEEAIRVMNRLRGHLPALLALSANSPFWQGRDTGLASARTPLFQAFPGSASRAASAATPTTSGRSTCWSAARPSPSRPSCGGTCGPSRGSGPSRCASWTPRRRSPRPPR